MGSWGVETKKKFKLFVSQYFRNLELFPNTTYLRVWAAQAVIEHSIYQGLRLAEHTSPLCPECPAHQPALVTRVSPAHALMLIASDTHDINLK